MSIKCQTSPKTTNTYLHLDHYNTHNLDLKHVFIIVSVYLGLLSCFKVHLSPRLSSFAASNKFCSSVALNLAEGLHAWSMVLSLSMLMVVMVCLAR